LTKRSPRTFKPAAGSGTPLYLQLARFLSEAVRSGQYESNEALPSERALSESLGLSRVTTRKAIDQLTLQGLIVRRRGSGNYIAAPRVEQALSRLTSFSEDLRARGYSPSSRWLSREITPPTDQERELLRLPRAAKVARLKRLRIGDETVMALEECVLPASVLPDPHQARGLPLRVSRGEAQRPGAREREDPGDQCVPRSSRGTCACRPGAPCSSSSA
jgi:GntR family transcriptional regulator